jgi:hypothetical protein
MDILYYSNYCKHSQKVLQTLSKTTITDKISFICIDKRVRDPTNHQLYIQLENGSKVIMPPNVHSVPALLLVKKNYNVIYGGDDIIQHFQSDITTMSENATKTTGEPMSYVFGSNPSSNIVSEQYTYYDMSPEELSSKGKGGMRQMHNYVSISNGPNYINTPPDTYRPDKLSNSVTIENLQKLRDGEIPVNNKPAFSI